MSAFGCTAVQRAIQCGWRSDTHETTDLISNSAQRLIREGNVKVFVLVIEHVSELKLEVHEGNEQSSLDSS